MSAAAAKGAKRPPGLWLQGLACGALVTLAPSWAVLLGVLLAPTVAAFLLDPRTRKPVVRPMLMFGLAACLRPSLQLWHGGHSLESAFGLAFDLGGVSIAWAAQSGGWLLAETLPVIVRLVLNARANGNAARLRSERARHEADWGIPPREGTDVSAAP